MGAGIVLDAQRLYAPGELLLFGGGIALGLDFSLALAVGSLCFLEDAEKMLALREGRWLVRAAWIEPMAGYVLCVLTLLTTLPLLLMTVMVSPSPTAIVTY